MFLEGEMALQPDIFALFLANSITCFFLQARMRYGYMFTLSLGVSWLSVDYI